MSDTRIDPSAVLALLGLPLLVWFGNPALALLAGLLVVVLLDRKLFSNAARLSKVCLQTAIVLLGFRLNLETVWALSADYALLTSGYVLITLLLGAGLGKLLSVERVPGQLIASGTAICGGTTIASLSPLLGARSHETAVALGLVFLMNTVALFVFPLIGRLLELSQLEFGLWSALAIHDTSSVVATAAIYGEQAQDIATTIKLGRTLWLIPAVFLAGLGRGGDGAGLRVPLFILLFLGAVAAASVLPLPPGLVGGSSAVSKALLVVALFFIGTQLTRATLRQIRGRVVWQAVVLWLLVVPLSLIAVRLLVN